MLDAYQMIVPKHMKSFFSIIIKKSVALTTESNTGKNILAVLKFDVTSVKNPLIIIINKITPARGIPAKNFNARATLNDNFEAF